MNVLKPALLKTREAMKRWHEDFTVNLYIYCTPCSCLISTALHMCMELNSSYIHSWVRADARLASTCCDERKSLTRVDDFNEQIRKGYGYRPKRNPRERTMASPSGKYGRSRTIHPH